MCGYLETKKQRSNPQNRYFRGVVVPMVAEAMGERNHEHVAELLKGLEEAGPIMREYYDFGNTKIYRIKSTTELTTVQWEELMSIYREWGSTFLKIYIPEPNEHTQEV